jgi:peptidoglycan/LPS O-acetylase OafA/YrhL
MNIKVRRAFQALAVPPLLALAWFGIQGGIQQWSEPQSLAQRIQTLSQFAYGGLALLTVATTLRSDMLGRTIRVAWLVSLVLSAGMAAVVWGGAPWWSGVAAGLLALVVALLILWMLRAGATKREAKLAE